MTLVESLLNALYGSDIPKRLARLVDPETTLQALVDFKLNPVLSSDASQPTRLAVANTGEREEWIRGVAEIWRNPAIATFWSSAPKHTRHMVDTDGSRKLVVYNDDLQPPPGPLLAMTLSLPKVGPELILRTPQLPNLPPPFASGVEALLSAGAKGQWAIRYRREEITGVLWVSESRWRGDAPQTTRKVLGLPMSGGWHARWETLERSGFHLYPDAVEFRLDGTVDLTVGFLPGKG